MAIALSKNLGVRHSRSLVTIGGTIASSPWRKGQRVAGDVQQAQPIQSLELAHVESRQIVVQGQRRYGDLQVSITDDLSAAGIAGSFPRITCGPNATATFGGHYGKLIIRFWILDAPTAKKVEQVYVRLAGSGNGHDSGNGAACLCQDSRFAFDRDLFHQLGKTESRILNGHRGFAHKSILLPVAIATQAEGKGFEPSTPCGASDFESDR
jgi:hypothetical protein